MKERTKKDLDPNKATHQTFKKRVKRTKTYKGCLECSDNEQGFCKKFNQWCYMCSYHCDPKQKDKVYTYKDKYGKKHHTKY